MAAFKYRMGVGFPGIISRDSFNSSVEPYPIDATLAFTGYGLPVQVSATGTATPVQSGATSDKIMGFLVKPFPITGFNATSPLQAPLGNTAPNGYGIYDVMRRGYMTVYCNNGTPAVGGRVGVRVASGSTSHPIGGIETIATETGTSLLMNGSSATDLSVSILGVAGSPQPGAYRAVITNTASSPTYLLYSPDGRKYGTGTVNAGPTTIGDLNISISSALLAKGDEFIVNVNPAGSPNVIDIPYAFFTGAADANGIVEISYKVY